MHRGCRVSEDVGVVECGLNRTELNVCSERPWDPIPHGTYEIQRGILQAGKSQVFPSIQRVCLICLYNYNSRQHGENTPKIAVR